MKKGFVLVCLVAISVLPVVVSAQGLNYTYIEGGYLRTDIDEVKIDGVYLGGSLLLNSNIFVTAELSETESERLFGGTRIEQESIDIAAGFRLPLAPATDWVSDVSVVRAETKLRGLSGKDSDTGYGVSTGIRHLLTEQVEVNAGVSFLDIYDDSDTAIGAGMVFHFNPSMGLTAGYARTDDVDNWSVGFRLKF